MMAIDKSELLTPIILGINFGICFTCPWPGPLLTDVRWPEPQPKHQEGAELIH